MSKWTAEDAWIFFFSVAGYKFLFFGMTVEALTLWNMSFLSLCLLTANFLDIGLVRGVKVQSFISLITLESSYTSKGLFC